MEALAFMNGPCEMEQAAGTATAGPVQIDPAFAYDAFLESVEKELAVAAQIPQYILCKHLEL